MPNCFNLTRKTAPQEGPINLATVDEELCRHLGMEVDPDRYCLGWFGSVGFGLAMGHSFARLREMCMEPNNYPSPALLPVIDFLDANFTTNAWADRVR